LAGAELGGTSAGRGFHLVIYSSRQAIDRQASHSLVPDSQ
jgi:hypothetical protein